MSFSFKSFVYNISRIVSVYHCTYKGLSEIKIYYQNADAGAIYKEKTEFIHYVQKMKLAMNSIIYFHVIILITKENCTLNKSLETDMIFWNSRKLWHLKINMIFKYYVDLLSWGTVVIINKGVCPNSKATKLFMYILCK